MFKRILIVLGIIFLGGGLYFGWGLAKSATKKHSPFAIAKYAQHNTKIDVEYCRPYTKGREIFGGELVPFGKVWRTGANEATILKTNRDLQFGDKTLKQGNYSLWTIPDKESWKVIFNEEIGQWGVGFGGVANMNPDKNILEVSVPVQSTQPTEQLTIEIKEGTNEQELHISWDKTKVVAPFKVL